MTAKKSEPPRHSPRNIMMGVNSPPSIKQQRHEKYLIRREARRVLHENGFFNSPRALFIDENQEPALYSETSKPASKTQRQVSMLISQFGLKDAIQSAHVPDGFQMADDALDAAPPSRHSKFCS